MIVGKQREIVICEEKSYGRVLSVGRRQHAWQREVLVTVTLHPSSHGMLKEAGDCTDTWRLKTLLSSAVVPCHKSVLSHPFCTDKAVKCKHQKCRDTFFPTLWTASLTLCSHIPFSYIHYLFFIHQIRKSDKLDFSAWGLFVYSMPYFLL